MTTPKPAPRAFPRPTSSVRVDEDWLAAVALVVAVEAVGQAVVDIGVAVGAQAASRLAAELVVVEAEVDVVGHVQVEVAIQIRVAECRRCAPGGVGAAALGRCKVERAVAGVHEEPVRSESGQIEIWVAIAVHVAGHGAHAVAVESNT